METTVRIGKKGEEAALRFLMDAGMTFIAANVHCGHNEIDLIMRDGEYYVFVEVKARMSTEYGLPREFVTPAKQKRIVTAARRYLYENRLGEVYTRFDVVEVYLESGKVCHFRDAFRA